MTWEYKTLIETNCYTLNEALNRQGNNGWEAYGSATICHRDGSTTHIAYLKRSKREYGKRLSRHSRQLARR